MVANAIPSSLTKITLTDKFHEGPQQTSLAMSRKVDSSKLEEGVSKSIIQSDLCRFSPHPPKTYCSSYV